MKIKELHIENYKNLNAHLVHQSDLIAFIGNNGSGKSNILEALSQIFRSLYKPSYKVDFDYTIEYEISNQNNRVKIVKKGSGRNFLVDNRHQVDITNYLPQKVIAIYSGEESRLFSECYEPFQSEFIRNINKAQIQGTDYSNLPKMLYLNKSYWHLSLLSLIVSNSEDNKRFVKNVLKINSVEKIKIDFQKKNYEEYNDNLALKFVRDIDTKDEYEYEEFKELILDKGYLTDDLYKYLYLAYAHNGSKIIDDIIIKFNRNLTIADLSEGEKKLLLIKAALEFAAHEDSLFIFDEPDVHVHLNNKEQIIKSFEPYKSNRQIIITTHSPTITQAMEDENVYMLNSGKIEDRNRQEIIAEIAGEFWNKHQQNSFLSSKKPIVLLVEGKHDKEHITNAFKLLKPNYGSLDFDIFSLGGESKIAPFLRGLYEGDLSDEKIFIAIYDNDNAGIEAINKGGYDKEVDSCGYRKLKCDKVKHSNFYAFVLPKPVGHTDDCTIENLYDIQKFRDAYQEALTKEIDFRLPKSIADFSKNILERAKNILAANSENFGLSEFEEFKKLLDLIVAIKNESALSASNDQNNVNVPPPDVDITMEDSTDKPVHKPVTNKKAKDYSEENYLKAHNKNAITIYKQFRNAILKLDNAITIEPRKQYIAFKKDKNIVYITVLSNSLKIWINVKKGELNDPRNLMEDVSGKGHWGYGDYQIVIKNDIYLEYIMNLVKQTIV